MECDIIIMVIKWLLENLIILDGFVFEDNYAIAVKKGNTQLLNKINEVIDNLKNSGKIDEYILEYSK